MGHFFFRELEMARRELQGGFFSVAYSFGSVKE